MDLIVSVTTSDEGGMHFDIPSGNVRDGQIDGFKCTHGELNETSGFPGIDG